MNAAPVFLLVEPSPILQSVLHKWLQDTLNNPRILIAANGVRGLPEARIVATGWYDNSFLLDRIKSTGADGYIVKDKLVSGLLPLWKISIE